MTAANLFVLGAGRPVRGEDPSVLLHAGNGRVLDWVLAAFEGIEVTPHFVGGFHAEQVRERYPGLAFTENPEWATTGSAVSLLRAPLPAAGEVFACYGDVLFRSDLVQALTAAGGDVCVAVDSHWRQRFAGRGHEDLVRCEKAVFSNDRILRLGPDIDESEAHAEFIGLVLIGPAALGRLEALAGATPARLQRANLSTLIESLRLDGLDVRCVDVCGDWAELNEARDVAHFVMGTKAETLARLRSQVRLSIIQDQARVTFQEWNRDRDASLARIRSRFGDARLVVRSSARKEDSFATANAGVFTSLLDVEPVTGITPAVEEVFGSYGGAIDEDQVLVQPMVYGVKMHGVVFTRTLDRGAPYYVVNYDCSGDTEAITSGRSTDSQTLVVHRDVDLSKDVEEPFRSVLAAVRELEGLLHYDALDIEFAIGPDDRVHVFQVRPITVGWSEASIDDEQCARALRQATGAWKRLGACPPFLPCGTPLFGVMPDWNPAEIIGTAPGALARSLYRFLVTDEIWATQRAQYGYRDVRPQQLLVEFAGRPYVDVRASFASFVPATLPDELASRLVAFYLDYLLRHPHLHDKVEFEVVPTCMALDFDRWRERLAGEGGFSRADVDALAEGLRAITAAAFGTWREHLVSVETLSKRFELISATEGLGHLERARLLLDDCRRYGTLPFAHLARSAFVAVTLLRSAVATGVMEQGSVDAFMASLSTVTSTFSNDIREVADGRLAFEELVRRYGHLRPGTYDIVSPCYASDPDAFLAPLVREARETHALASAGSGAWSGALPAVLEALHASGLPADADEVEAFLRGAIAGREYAKFCFSRNLSAALEHIAAFGRGCGLDRRTLANLPLHSLLDLGLAAPEADVVDALRRMADSNEERQRVAAACPMPPLITGPRDFVSFTYSASQPNFVGTSRVRAPVVRLAGSDGRETRSDGLAGRIVLIPQADPGYDWLFGQGIAGLVTMYGGANSHMAIRAAEFRLPAAIGVGQGLYERLSGSRLIDLDPANQRIEGIHQ